jgi:polysaccharide pyruvyl transferase WcaK-like protein
VRILVDQSGYDLLNIGDVAMLQSCVIRLRQLWPGAEIMVVSHAPERLACYCPDAAAIGRTYADRPFARFLPRGPRLASEQAWKMTAPYFSNRLGLRHIRLGRPRTAVQAVHAADLVVASGGGYITDSWWWHAAGVLSLLSLAQRLGKPTAMFGQGIGPIRQRVLRAQARAVLPRLAVLGLREEQIGRDLALSFGARPGAVLVTGDDALELIAGTSAPDGRALGVNVRVSGYAGVDPTAAAAIGDLLLESAGDFQADIVALPVSRYAADADLAAIRALLRARPGRSDIVLHDLTAPEALVTAAARCRAIVTGSYHAAVFGLAQGVPAVCLTKSSYYDAKFAGLRALFPGTCSVVSLGQSDCAGRLRAAIHEAWHLPAAARAAARDAAALQRQAGRDAYAQFRAVVEKNPVLVTADSQGLTA